MFSLFVPLLINLRTTYHRPQFPPVKKEKRHQKQNLQKKRIDCMRRSIICVTHHLKHLSEIHNPSESTIIIHKLVKICPLPCSSWSSQCGICWFLVFPCTFPGFFDGRLILHHVRLIMYKFVQSHFNNFVISKAFFQRTAYVVNTNFPFHLFHES